MMVWRIAGFQRIDRVRLGALNVATGSVSAVETAVAASRLRMSKGDFLGIVVYPYIDLRNRVAVTPVTQCFTPPSPLHGERDRGSRGFDIYITKALWRTDGTALAGQLALLAVHPLFRSVRGSLCQSIPPLHKGAKSGIKL